MLGYSWKNIWIQVAGKTKGGVLSLEFFGICRQEDARQTLLWGTAWRRQQKLTTELHWNRQQGEEVRRKQWREPEEQTWQIRESQKEKRAESVCRRFPGKHGPLLKQPLTTHVALLGASTGNRQSRAAGRRQELCDSAVRKCNTTWFKRVSYEIHVSGCL